MLHRGIGMDNHRGFWIYHLVTEGERLGGRLGGGMPSPTHPALLPPPPHIRARPASPPKPCTPNISRPARFPSLPAQPSSPNSPRPVKPTQLPSPSQAHPTPHAQPCPPNSSTQSGPPGHHHPAVLTLVAHLPRRSSPRPAFPTQLPSPSHARPVRGGGGAGRAVTASHWRPYSIT